MRKVISGMIDGLYKLISVESLTPLENPGQANKTWIRPVIRATGLWFILYGVWGVIAALLLKWNFPSNIPVISGNLPFGIAGIVSIIAGYLLIQMKEIGRKLAYLVCWANLASITMTTTSFSNGGSTLEVRSLTFHVTSSWPSLGILIASTLFVFVVLHILLIVLFSSRIIKELFSS